MGLPACSRAKDVSHHRVVEAKGKEVTDMGFVDGLVFLMVVFWSSRFVPGPS